MLFARASRALYHGVSKPLDIVHTASWILLVNGIDFNCRYERCSSALRNFYLWELFHNYC